MKRWSKYIKPYTLYFILGPICMIIEVIGEVLMPSFLAEIIDVGILNGDWKYITGTCALMVFTVFCMMAGGIGGAYFGAKASINFGSDLRKDIYKKIQSFSFYNIDKFSTGSLVTRLTNDVTQLQQFINMMLRMFLRSPGMLIGALIMAIIKSPSLATVLAVVIPILLISLGLVIKSGFPRFAKMQEKIDNLNSNVQENITNIRVVKSFVREGFEEEKFRNSNKGLKDAGINVMKIMSLTGPIMTVLMGITSVAVVLLGGNMIISDPNSISVGDLTAFITYVTQILMSLMMVSMLFVFSSRAIASGKRICEVMDEKVSLTDENAAEKDKKVSKGDIEFRNVAFSYYKSSQEKVIENINLKIEHGKTVGIIGSTGSGKTTLVSMIPRLYDVDEGEVLVDGVNVKDYSLKNLRDAVGMVLQKNTLFSGSIAENLRWGDLEASDEEVIAAAKNSQADLFISSFKDGYEHILEQGGVNVSGGQKQRLCIARALLKKPKILILDDSTSAVDTATEAKIRATFKNELCDSTKIIIAQRISSVKDADEIIVLNDGKITGIGTHDELIQNNTEYQEIYSSQMDKNSGREVSR